MPTTVLIVLGLAVILAVCCAVVWRRASHRADRLNLRRLDQDEERFSEVAPDPRTRMR